MDEKLSLLFFEPSSPTLIHTRRQFLPCPPPARYLIFLVGKQSRTQPHCAETGTHGGSQQRSTTRSTCNSLPPLGNTRGLPQLRRPLGFLTFRSRIPPASRSLVSAETSAAVLAAYSAAPSVAVTGYVLGAPAPSPQQYAEQQSPPYSAGSGFSNDQFEVPPTKRQKVATPMQKSGSKSSPPKSGKGTPGSDMAGADSTPAKSRRVRTGCLTCRERHLKCDEGMPDCVNCRKSNRECKRGVRLNFIDMTCKEPPYIPPTDDWSGKCFSSGEKLPSF